MQKHLINSPDQVLSLALDIGAGMLSSGAEINRVEDTIKRICQYFLAEQVDVFATPYNIIVTTVFEKSTYTQSRRILRFSYDLESLAQLNSLSRRLCQGEILLEDVEIKLDEIRKSQGASELRKVSAYYIIAFGFCIFFGGNMKDAIIAGFIACAMRLVERLLNAIKINRFIVISACGFVIALLTKIAEGLAFGLSREHMSIGITMILISGLLFTNSFKEMFMDNILTGAVKLFEALFIAMAIYIGFAMLALLNWG